MFQPDSSPLGSGEPTRHRLAVERAPFAHVQGLDAPGRGRFGGALFAALALHVALAARSLWNLDDVGAFARLIQQSIQAQIEQRMQIAIEPEPVAEPEPEPEPVPEPEPTPAPPVEKPPPAPREVQPPAPAEAQAARVLTAEPDPDEPLDLTGNAFVQGNADSYAGGVTASKGTATQAVRSRVARGDGVVGGTGTAAASAVDRSRRAEPVETNWDCPFPAESDVEQINYQQVNVAVTVSSQGKALDVKVLGSPGFGFGRAAQRCGLGKTFLPALDREGSPVTTTIQIKVTFKRR